MLAGSWGLYTKGYRSRPDGGASGSSIQPIGSSLWLKINRDKSSETFKGIADLPVRENFHLWGMHIAWVSTSGLPTLSLP